MPFPNSTLEMHSDDVHDVYNIVSYIFISAFQMLLISSGMEKSTFTSVKYLVLKLNILIVKVYSTYIILFFFFFFLLFTDKHFTNHVTSF